MSTQQKNTLDPKSQERLARQQKRDHKVEHLFRRVLHVIERFIAVFILLALLAALGIEIYRCCTNPEYLSDLNGILHNVLTVVVGLEFVRMLLDTTPTNILEVLMVAITRHVILSHDDPWSNIACIACIAGLFAIRRFLVLRSELKEEMLDLE